MILTYIPPMDTIEFVIVCALFGVLILWFGVYFGVRFETGTAKFRQSGIAQ